MRIVAGRHRGKRLKTLAGRELRPTADRVREALFNVLVHGDWPGGDPVTGTRVVDAFAGSGALGLEALSRGAAHVTFLENAAPACRLIEANARALGETAHVAVLRRDATRPGPAPAPCALAFLDPPYRSGLGTVSLEALAAAGWLTDDALCVLELARKESFPAPDGFTVIDERTYGDTRLVFLAGRSGP
jgi:16S rRNA (guanine966-N2)-methyltransferase